MSLTWYRERDPSHDTILDTARLFITSVHVCSEVIEWEIWHSEFRSYLSPTLALEYMEEYRAYEHHSRISLRHKTRLRHDAIDPIIVTRFYEMRTEEPHNNRGLRMHQLQIRYRERRKRQVKKTHYAVSFWSFTSSNSSRELRIISAIENFWFERLCSSGTATHLIRADFADNTQFNESSKTRQSTG